MAVLAGVAGVLVAGASPAGAVPADDEATFRAAWAAPATTTIELTADIVLTCAGGTTPTRSSANAITIVGGGHTIRNTCDGADQGVLRATGNAPVDLLDVTITGGRGVGLGAGSGLDAVGLITLERAVVLDNDGVGVRSSGNDVRAEQSTISDNGEAGVDAGDAVVSQSTVSGNGEGIDTDDEAVIVLSTVHGNVETGVEGLELAVAQSTVTGNDPNIETNDLFLAGSVVGESPTTNCEQLAVDSFGGNLVDDTTCDLPTAEETTGSLGLGPLQDNGGHGPTRMPSASSALLDRIAVAACDDLDPEGFDILGEEVDQRGFARPGEATGGGCDTGAVERCTDGTFPDVAVTGQFARDICWMGANGITTGFGDGTYQPGGAVSRQAMSAFMYRLAGEPAFSPPVEPTFGDVSTGGTFFTEIEWMAAEGITTGTPASPKPLYKPSVAVSRQAMSAFMFRLAGSPEFAAPVTPTFVDVPASNQFFDEVEWMAEEEITTGFATSPPTFQPAAAVSRQAMSAFMRRLDQGPGVGIDL